MMIEDYKDSELPGVEDERGDTRYDSFGLETLFAAEYAGRDILTEMAEAIAVVAKSRSNSFVEPTTTWTDFNICTYLRGLQSQQVLNGLSFSLAQFVYLASAIQPTLNGWTAFEWLFAKNKCSVGDPACYIAWDGPRSLAVYLFVFCTFYANYRISLEFMPSTFKALSKMFSSAQSLLLQWRGIYDENARHVAFNFVSGVILAVALLLAIGGATVTFELGRESLVLFHDHWAWLNTLLLITAVGSTLSTRFIGCRAMLHIFYQRLLAYAYVDLPLRRLGYEDLASFYEQRRCLLKGMHDLYFSEYRLPEDIWNNVSTEIHRAQYLRAFKELYIHKNASTSSDSNWLGLLAHTRSNRWTQYAYNFALFTCYFFAIVSYPVIYNITRKAFPQLESWSSLSYGIVLASTLFYIYAIGRLPDQIARELTVSFVRPHSNYAVRWAMLAWSFFIGMASCGNFLYTALAQADEGSLDHWGLTHEQAGVFFSIVGAVISGGCNLYAVLSIDESYAVAERYHTSGQRFYALTKFIENTSTDVAEAQQGAAEIVKNAYREHCPSWCSVFKADDSLETRLLERTSTDNVIL